jgi:4-amino-4-deoxy-L-arabinose transferase-like glycosyltransferase
VSAPRPKKQKVPSEAAPQAAIPLAGRIIDFFGRHAAILTIAFALIATVRIVATYTVFNDTSDEPAHIACGMQWLDQHIYQYEHQHPPLTRVMVALGPYLAGARGQHQEDMNIEGDAILYRGNQYDLRLALARAGNLPFLWLACWMVFLWGRRILGDAGAAVAVLIFTMTPVVLAHAGLATTDIGVTACLAAALYATLRWIEEPGTRTGIWLGVAGGLAALAKFSALVYFPAALGLAGITWIVLNRKSLARPAIAPLLQSLAIALPLAFVIVWAGYRFSFGHAPGISFRLPFPEFYSGIQQVSKHNSDGHLSYLFGQLRMVGWWYFFPVLLAVKLPIALLGLIGLGVAIGFRREASAGSWPVWIATMMSAGMLVVAMSAHINIGLRHILPMFPFLAIVAAAGVLELIRRGVRQTWATWVLAAGMLWLCGSSLLAHPDYLPYFNEFAGEHPENIVVDSDLDWGQDLKRLGARLQELRAPFVTFTPIIGAGLSTFGFPPHQRSAYNAPDPGWNAVSISEWKLYRLGLQMRQPGDRVWPDVVQPTERVGKSIYLYYIPPR